MTGKTAQFGEGRAFLDQAGLADAGLAADADHGGPTPSDHSTPGVEQRRELVDPVDERPSGVDEERRRQRQLGQAGVRLPLHLAGGDRLREPLQHQGIHRAQRESAPIPEQQTDHVAREDRARAGGALEAGRLHDRRSRPAVIERERLPRRQPHPYLEAEQRL